MKPAMFQSPRCVPVLWAFFLLAAVLFTGCGGKPAPAPERHYQLRGEVVSLDVKQQTATIKHGPISGWMDAMTMEYPVKSKAEFDALHPGEQIVATVNVRGDDYELAGIQAQANATGGAKQP